MENSKNYKKFWGRLENGESDVYVLKVGNMKI